MKGFLNKVSRGVTGNPAPAATEANTHHNQNHTNSSANGSVSSAGSSSTTTNSSQNITSKVPTAASPSPLTFDNKSSSHSMSGSEGPLSPTRAAENNLPRADITLPKSKEKKYVLV